MNNLKKTIIEELIETDFFNKCTSVQAHDIEKTINMAFIKKYGILTREIEYSKSLVDNMKALENVLSASAFETIGREIVCIALDIFSYVQGRHICWRISNNENELNSDGTLKTFNSDESLNITRTIES